MQLSAFWGKYNYTTKCLEDFLCANKKREKL